MRAFRLALRFCRSIRGTVAVEFAFALPMLIALLLLGVQVVTYANAVRKVELLTTSISEMISQATANQQCQPPTTPGATTTYVCSQDIHFSYDAGLVVFPYLMADSARQGVAWWQDINIDYASIQFTNISGTSCPANGDQSPCYTANVVWTSTGTTGTNYRPCTIPQLPMNDTAAPNKATLPRSVYGPGSIIVVDVVFTFHPTFAGNLLPTLRIARSVYVRPRYATLIDYSTTGNDGIATLCPGYT